MFLLLSVHFVILSASEESQAPSYEILSEAKDDKFQGRNNKVR